MPQEDLFGNPVDDPVPQTKPREVTNDMEAIERVLRTAIQDGFVLVPPADRVYQRVGREEIDHVSSDVDAIVHQLIDTGYLEVGGTHQLHFGHHVFAARSVLVPRRAKGTTRRWDALHRPASWKSTTARKTA